MRILLPYQQELRQPLPVIVGNADYTEFQQILEKISELISLSGLDQKVMRYAVDEAERIARDNFQGQSASPCLGETQQIKIQKKAELVLRLMIIKELKGMGFRPFSCALAESPLLQWFCKIDRIDTIKVPSKSALERYEKMFPEKFINELIHDLINAASLPRETEGDKQLHQLDYEIDLVNFYLDTTCIKANIHYPVDWILLRDATRTLMKAVILIRKHGLKNRMDDPCVFLTAMNKLCIKMTHARNQKDSKKGRKKIFRLMKELMKKIQKHAERHKILLETHWEETDLSEKQKARILERMDMVLNDLPQAIQQANDRIITGIQAKNEEKILSLYDENINVLVRKKAGMQVEFGNKLLLCEQENGIIIDWKLYKDGSPSDVGLLQESIERIKERYNSKIPYSVTTDRGFFSKSNKKYLAENNITDYMCPRSVAELNERLQDDEFVKHQTRRGQTEARIAIFKNKFLGKPLRSKGFSNRSKSVAWAVLSHNLWVVARLPLIEEISLQKTG